MTAQVCSHCGWSNVTFAVRSFDHVPSPWCVSCATELGPDALGLADEVAHLESEFADEQATTHEERVTAVLTSLYPTDVTICI